MDKITELVNKYELDKVDAGCLYNSQELKENLIKDLKQAIDYSRCCKSDSEQLPNMTLEQAIAKAKQNLDKITDVDKHIEDIR